MKLKTLVMVCNARLQCEMMKPYLIESIPTRFQQVPASVIGLIFSNGVPISDQNILINFYALILPFVGRRTRIRTRMCTHIHIHSHIHSLIVLWI